MFGGAPILILSPNVKRDSGRKVQLENVAAGKTISDLIRTCLGPNAMMKMLMDPMGGIVMTNDGNAILREITVQHPAAKTMVEIARTQDEEVGDGTTSVIILAGEMLYAAEPFLGQQIHPMVIIRAYRKALDDIIDLLDNKYSFAIDVSQQERIVEVVEKCISTKFMAGWSPLACQIAIDAVKLVMDDSNSRTDVDIKRYVRVEKVPGGSLEDSSLLDGIMINKDITHPAMRRKIENPRIILLDCPLEYKKGESQTNIEMACEGDFKRLLELEEEYIRDMVADLVERKPDLVITEKGVSDLAQHFLAKNGITALRRLRKTDNCRLAKAVGGNICNNTNQIREEDIGKGCQLFEIKKIGDEYFSFFTHCINPKACTILLRGPSKDILNEAERNLQDALHVARNIMLDPRLVLGGGCIEMNLSRELVERSKNLSANYQGPYRAVANALSIIPRILAHNCGKSMVKLLTELHEKQTKYGKVSTGVDGITGELIDVMEAKIYDPLTVKQQVYKTAIETAILLLKIDDVVSGSKKKDSTSNKSRAQPTSESMKE